MVPKAPYSVWPPDWQVVRVPGSSLIARFSVLVSKNVTFTHSTGAMFETVMSYVIALSPTPRVDFQRSLLGEDSVPGFDE